MNMKQLLTKVLSEPQSVRFMLCYDQLDEIWKTRIEHSVEKVITTDKVTDTISFWENFLDHLIKEYNCLPPSLLATFHTTIALITLLVKACSCESDAEVKQKIQENYTEIFNTYPEVEFENDSDDQKLFFHNFITSFPKKPLTLTNETYQLTIKQFPHIKEVVDSIVTIRQVQPTQTLSLQSSSTTNNPRPANPQTQQRSSTTVNPRRVGPRQQWFNKFTSRVAKQSLDVARSLKKVLDNLYKKFPNFETDDDKYKDLQRHLNYEVEYKTNIQLSETSLEELMKKFPNTIKLHSKVTSIHSVSSSRSARKPNKYASSSTASTKDLVQPTNNRKRSATALANTASSVDGKQNKADKTTASTRGPLKLSVQPLTNQSHKVICQSAFNSPLKDVSHKDTKLKNVKTYMLIFDAGKIPAEEIKKFIKQATAANLQSDRSQKNMMVRSVNGWHMRHKQSTDVLSADHPVSMAMQGRDLPVGSMCIVKGTGVNLVKSLIAVTPRELLEEWQAENKSSENRSSTISTTTNRVSKQKRKGSTVPPPNPKQRRTPVIESESSSSQGHEGTSFATTFSQIMQELPEVPLSTRQKSMIENDEASEETLALLEQLKEARDANTQASLAVKEHKQKIDAVKRVVKEELKAELANQEQKCEELLSQQPASFHAHYQK